MRQLTRRNRPGSLAEKIGRLNRYIRGWVAYFRYGRSRRLMERLDQWLRRKVRVIKLKQLKLRYTIFKFFQSGGVSTHQAWILALSGKGWWRMSRCPQAHQAMDLRWFKEQGLAGVLEGWEDYRRKPPGAEQACRVV